MGFEPTTQTGYITCSPQVEEGEIDPEHGAVYDEFEMVKSNF
jgi:hypothetical protein